jgi:hypothetical protein
MRIPALLAASVLLAACSHAGQSEHTQTPSPTSATPATPSVAPVSGAPISAVIAWIEAARPADPARYHEVIRDGTTTPLGADIAFAANGKVACTTDAKHTGGALTCLVKLTNPPPAPPTAYGEWQGGWVDFDGSTLHVGASRGDPGPFVNGNGPVLADGDSLSFGDYRCRAEPTGAVCVNYAHQSAARFGPAGIEPFGCLRAGPPPDGVGLAFSC